MRHIQLGSLRAHIAGGTDREGGGEGPVVVLMHGFGAPGTDLVGLSRVLDVPPETRFVFPEGPIAMPALGFGEPRAWWHIDLEALEQALRTGRPRDRSREVPEGLAEARAAMLTLLDRLEEELSVRGEQMVLGGFSQGAMLALDIALRDARPLAGLCLFSATLLAKDQWVPRMPTRADLPTLLTHGSLDDLLPFSLAEELRDQLTAAGLDVTWVPFRGGHELPQPVLHALEAFLVRVFGDGSDAPV